MPKTLKKDLKEIEERLARFRMDAVLPGTWLCEGGGEVGQRATLIPVPFPMHTLGVPATKPLSELQVPVTKVTTLDNGLRVATQETYGAVRQQHMACRE